MFAQQNQLKEIFQQNGWELVKVIQPTDNWIADFWIIKSLWSPTDCKVYVLFLVDPQYGNIGNLSKEEAKLNVWEVLFSLKNPTELGYLEFLIEDERFSALIKSQWEKQIPEIIEGLEKLRNNFKKTFHPN